MPVTIQLSHLVFTSPRLPPARVNFGPGLNLIYGPSNTGKSSIFDAIDFMLGRGRALKEIPEHDGYEYILLGIEASDGRTFTLQRSVSGGDLRCYEGLHYEPSSERESTVLKPKHRTKKIDSLPNFVFGMVGMSGKSLKKNARNETESLTLRNFVPLFLINETEIQKESSPYVSTQFLKKTSDRSRLRYVLTGVDDSSLVPEEKEKQTLSRQARLHLLSELISEQEDAIAEATEGTVDREDLEKQATKLSATLSNENAALISTEADYRENVDGRNKVRRTIEISQTRLSEIQEMAARFRLLYEQYDSDILRLENLIEAGTLFVALPTGICPLCGTDTSADHDHSKCDEDAEMVVRAANVEKDKIASLKSELDDVLEQLKAEEATLRRAMPEAVEQLEAFNRSIEQINPIVAEQRVRYSDALFTKTKVEKILGLFDDLERLERKRREIEDEAPEAQAANEGATALPTKSLHDLSKIVSELLVNWGLPNTDHIYYDKETDDFVIGGKHRASNGKGHRALTHAAATLALLKYTEEKELSYPGFVVLDSPLLAYEKPEFDQENLAETDINLRFFEFLNSWKTRQVLILENKKSIPNKFEEGSQITHFTKSESNGRYGFFPRGSGR